MRCNRCNEDKLKDDFYASNLSTCKECVKKRARENREKKIDYYREYDRKRANRPDRVAARAAYQRTPEGKAASGKAKAKYIKSNPNKRRAHHKVNNAIRDGKLKREPCEECGKVAHAHHDDYSKPLEVRWLCAAHHQQWHAKHGEAKNP